MPTVFAGLIQSDFGDPDLPNFEAVVLNGEDLSHYWRDNGHFQHANYAPKDYPWNKGKQICARATQAGAIVQSHFKSGPTGNFEVVAPIEGPNGHDELWHFQLDNHNPGSDWRQIQRITAENDQVCGPASIIQSDLGEQHNNFEVVVPIMGPNGHAELWHFFNDNSRPGPWAPATPKQVTGAGDVVFGPGSIIQGSRGPDRNNFEVVVPILGSDVKPELWHYSHDNSKPGSEWVQAKRVTGPADSAAGGGVILESDFGDKRNGNFEVVVPLTMPAGNTELWHFWHDADPSTEWTRSNLITASVFGNAGVSFIRSNFHEGDHRNFEVLIEECAHSSIVHYFRHNSNVDNPWLRTGPIPGLGESVPCSIDPTVTMKICQLTGEFDLEGWDFVSLVERSPAGPSLASHAGRLFLACKGEDDRLNLILSINEGGSFQDKMTFNETSDDAPALTSHNGRLFLAWRGSGNANLQCRQGGPCRQFRRGL